MKRKIEPGMLCLVTGGRNTGRECTAIRVVQPGERIPETLSHYIGKRPVWFVQGPSIKCWVEFKFFGFGCEMYQNGYGYVREEHLLPIQPDQQLQQTEVKKLKVPHGTQELTIT